MRRRPYANSVVQSALLILTPLRPAAHRSASRVALACASTSGRCSIFVSITQMLAHPALIQWPIVVGDELALLAKPVERVLELL